MKLLQGLALSVLFAFVCACGGGSSQPTLSSLSVSPATVTLHVALDTQQLSVTGHYSDNSTKDLTPSAAWNSSSTNTAMVSNGGFVTPVAGGQAKITATAGGLTASSNVTVVDLRRGYITPSGPALSLTGTPSGVQLSVTGMWADGMTQDVTGTVQNWATSDSNIAAVNNTGYVNRGNAAGYTNISGTLGSYSVSTAVSVTNTNMSAANLNGTYVFALNGIQGTLPSFYKGIFTADAAGNLSGKLVAVAGADVIPMPADFTGTYSLFLDGRGDMEITAPAPLSPARLRFVLSSDGNFGKAILFDPAQSTTMVGEFHKQDAGPYGQASLNGPFVFRLGGTDYEGEPQAIVGMFNANGAGQIPSGTSDMNANGTINQGSGASLPTSGSYLLNIDGSGSLTLTVGSLEMHFALFAISSSRYILLCTDNGRYASGEFEAQQVPEGGFTSSEGSYTMLLENGGRPGVLGMAGILEIGPFGSFDGWLTQSAAGPYVELEVIQGTRTLSADGRGTIIVQFFVRPYVRYLNVAWAVYMVSPARMYVVETDPNYVFSGVADSHTGGLLNGPYMYAGGSIAAATGTESAMLALVDITTTGENGTLTGIADVNVTGGTTLPPGTRLFGSTVINGSYGSDVNTVRAKWVGTVPGMAGFNFYINSTASAVLFIPTGDGTNSDMDGWLTMQ